MGRERGARLTHGVDERENVSTIHRAVAIHIARDIPFSDSTCPSEALVLGDRAEASFRQAMLGSQGDMSVFFSNGLVGGLTALALGLTATSQAFAQAATDDPAEAAGGDDARWGGVQESAGDAESVCW